MTKVAITTELAKLIAALGFRVSNLNARKLGVPEHVLFDAVVLGLAKFERVHWGPCDVTTYIIFA